MTTPPPPALPSILRVDLKLILPTLLLCYLLYKAIATRYFHPLSKFPGPFWASVSPGYSIYCFFSGRQQEKQWELHRKYGPIVRYTPNLLIFNDPRALPVIYNRKAVKTHLYDPLIETPVTSVFSEQSAEGHAIARKRVAYTYSMAFVKTMEPAMDKQISEWCSILIERFARPAKEFDFAIWSQWLAYDVVTDLTFGSPLGFVANARDMHDLIKAFRIGQNLNVLAQLPMLLDVIKKSGIGYKFLLPRPGDKSGLGHVLSVRDRLIESRMKTGNLSGRVDFLDGLLQAKNADGTPLSTETIKIETLLVLLAGSETTAITFGNLLIHVLQTPTCLITLQQEIATANLSTPIPTYNECKSLPFFTACLRESIRLSPPVQALFPRMTQKGGVTLHGRYIPEGSEMASNPWVTQRCKEVYGDDAEVFRPERWLEAGEEVKAEWERLEFSWGYGTRICLGKNLALLELFKFGVQFFRMFEPELVNPETPCKIWNRGIAFQFGLGVRIKLRE